MCLRRPRSPWDFPSQLAEYIWLQIDTFESKRDLNIGQVTAVLKKPNLTRCNQRSPIKGAIPPATLPHVLCCILISCRLYGAVCSFRALFAGPARSFTVLIHCHSRQPFRHHQQQQQQEKKKEIPLKTHCAFSAQHGLWAVRQRLGLKQLKGNRRL